MLLLVGQAAHASEPLDIAYLRLTDGYWQAWVTDSQGSKHKQITRSPIDKTRLSWSKDRQELLCNRNDGSIARVSVSNGKETRLTLPMKGMLDAQWSPDNQWIAYSHSPEASPDTNDLWMVRTNGKDLRKLNNKPRLQLMPSWGARNKMLVYTSGTLKKRKMDIWTLDLKTGSKNQLTASAGLKFDPVFSSQGDVAYASNQNGNYDIWMIKKNEHQPFALTDTPAYEAQPSWSPDGTRIAYYALIDGKRRVWVKDLSSGKAHAVTPADSFSRYPAWGH
ncbi:MAG TPA: hypothetical protein ENI64_07150 [Gammaproteobacteria bacterium]|nr:hypothetical protein [Gammaproteobacteria bacterium]